MASVGTGVSIGSRNVRVLQVRKQKDGSWQVTRALIAPFSEADPPETRRVAEARSAVRTAQAKGPAYLAATGRDLIMRYTHVPPVPDWRLEMLMNFEIQEVAEQSGGDVSAAYAPLEVDDTSGGDNVVLVALTKNSYLKPRLQSVREGGADPLGACPRAVGAYWAYRENGKLGSDETVAIVHIGHENTDVAISRKGTLLFARNVAGGGRLLTDAVVQNLRVDAPTAEKLKITRGNLTPRGKAKYRDSMEEKVANALMQAGGHFVSAINSSVMFAKAQTKVPDCAIDRVVLMGSGSLLRGLPEYLESNLNLPVELFDPMDKVDLSALPAETANAVRQDQGGMAATLGLAQMAADESAFHVAILPEEDKRKRRFRERTVFSIASVVVLVVAIAVSWSMRSSAHAAAVAEKAALDEKARAYEKNRSEFERARQRVEVVTSQKDALRTIVALGPAFQIVMDAVWQVVLSGEGFDEIHFVKVSAKMEDTQVQDAQGKNQVFRVPVVEFEGRAQEIGGRTPAVAHSDLMTRIKEQLKSVGGVELSGDSGLNANDGTFKFRIRQTEFPEKVESDRRASGGG